MSDPRIAAIPDVHGHAKGEHRPFAEERPIAYSARMLFLWFFHACRRGLPRFIMVADHINYLTFEDPGAVNTLRRALKLARAGDLYGAAETAGVDVAHAAAVSEGLRRGMRFAIGAELDNDPRARPDAQNIVEAMRPDGTIRSVHFLTIEHPEKGPDWPWPFDNPEFVQFYDIVGVERTWELYMAKLLDDLEKLPGNIVGHFYVPAKFGHWPDRKTLERYEDQLIDVCARRSLAIEINTRALYQERPDDFRKKYIDANMRLMRKARARGVPIAIASDAHSPKDQSGAFDTVLRMLDECKINELAFPVAGRLARVALRATKEHLERHGKVKESPLPGSSISGYSRAELGLPEHVPVPAGRRGKRDTGPKKRVAGPTRTTKKPAKRVRERRPSLAELRRAAVRRGGGKPRPKPTAKSRSKPKTRPKPKAGHAKPAPKRAVKKPLQKKAAPKRSAPKPASKQLASKKLVPTKPVAKKPGKVAQKNPIPAKKKATGKRR